MDGVDEICVDRVCRSCLGEKSEMLSLFTPYQGPLEVNTSQYSKMLMDCAAITVREDDGMPGRICDQCRNMLVQANSFKAMCEKADAKLRAYTGGVTKYRETCTQTEDRTCLQVFNCSQCQKKFNGMAALQRHCRRHLGENSVACNSCSNLYCDNDALQRHVAKAHPSTTRETAATTTKVEVWEQTIEEKVYREDMKQEPSEIRVLVKEEPLEVFHEEDDTHSDYLAVKEELHSDHSDYTPPTTFDRKKTSKKKVKKQNTHIGDLPENHPCAFCSRVFASREHLETHIAKHAAKVQRYSCPCCDKSFTRTSHLKRHQRTVHPAQGDLPSGKGKCPHCSETFVKSDDLKNHIRNNHQDGEVVKNPKVAFCNLCERGFTTHRYLEIHMRSHRTRRGENGEEEVRGFPCKACQHVSQTKAESKAHTQWHRRAERPFLCSECGQGFTRDAYLIVHMRRHRGEKPFSCGYCGKGFPRRSDLDIHERYHTEDKRHKCAICGKAFHRQYNLKVHLRVHTGERPYVCSYCPKAFTQPNDLKAHVRRHTGERFTCELCSAQFLHGYHLTQHRRAVHAVDKPSHIRRLSKFPAVGPPEPTAEPQTPPSRGRARQAHIQLAAHMASILEQTQQQPVPPLSLPPPPAS